MSGSAPPKSSLVIPCPAIESWRDYTQPQTAALFICENCEFPMFLCGVCSSRKSLPLHVRDGAYSSVKKTLSSVSKRAQDMGHSMSDQHSDFASPSQILMKFGKALEPIEKLSKPKF